MLRGFTLIELLVAIFISGILFFVSLPNVHHFYQRYQLRQLAVELESFFGQARSEALSRKKSLWVQFSVQDNSSINGWRLSLVEEKNESRYGNEIRFLQGRGMVLSASWAIIKFDGRTGRVMENEHLNFSTESEVTPTLKLITHHITGRVRICAEGERFYGYPEC